MSNIYNKFEAIIDSYCNGNISYTKREIKSLRRNERYDLIMYTRIYLGNDTSDTFMRWCVTVDFT